MARILIVEDSRTQAAELRFVLEDAGCEVETATSGEEALARFDPARFELVISDIVMPGMTGYELCRRLKSQWSGAGVTVLLLSSLSDPMDIVSGLECGADNFVTKPYQPDALVRRVRTMLRNRSTRQGSTRSEGVEVEFLGQPFLIQSEKQQILDLLLSTFEDIVDTNRKLHASEAELSLAKQRIEQHARDLERQVLARTKDLERQRRSLAEAQSIAKLGSWRIVRGSETIEWSDEMYRIFGFAQPGAPVSLGAAVAKIHPLDRNRVERALGEAFNCAEGGCVEFRIDRADGVRHCWTEVRYERDVDGSVSALFGICQDWTELKQAEVTSRESVERYRELVDSLPEAVFVECANQMVFANEPAAQLMGPGLAGSELPDEFRRLTLLRPGAPHEQQLQRPDGSVIEAEILTSNVRYNGQPAVQVLIRDITERNEMARQMRQAQRLDAIGQLTGGVAHDFNNLLAIIAGNAELLREVATENLEAIELADEVLGAAKRGADLVRRLLAFARKQHLEPTAVDVNARLPELVALLRRTLGGRIRVETKTAPDLWQAMIDPAQIDDAILNLAINARDAMPDGGTLTVQTANMRAEAGADSDAATDFVMVAVSDTGVGMPPEVAERALEPFFTTKEPGRGTGLGLSQVYGMVAQSGGQLQIESRQGEGTTIRLYLPRLHNAVACKPASDEAIEVPPGSGTILVVEDDPSVRRLAVRQLKEFGYRVAEAEDGRQALNRLRAGDVDLLFTDVVMPGMTGYELAREAKALCSALPVLFASGYTRLEGSQGETELHLGPLLRKPYAKQELAQAVRAALDPGTRTA